MNKKIKLFLIFLLVTIAVIFIMLKFAPKEGAQEVVSEIKPVSGSIQAVISTTGTVLPKNRLEIKPPVAGRLESILVKEGRMVKAGEVLAWMSSTERAALLDAAKAQGDEKVKYWQGVYKPIALLAPIDAEVIVATSQPGQTVTTNDAVVVLSDRLIVRAQVDETDIGRISLGQQALVILDAYPQIKIKSKVVHVYYESKTVNNVTIYEADLIPEEMPPILRSGMNTTVDFIEKSKDGALLLPNDALLKEKDAAFVLVKQNGPAAPVKRMVELGLSDNKNTEIISGITFGDSIIVKSKKYSLPKDTSGTNPFMPWRKKATGR